MKGKDSYSEIDDLLEIMEMPYKFFENSFWLKGMFEKAQKEEIGVLLNGVEEIYYIMGVCFRLLCTSFKKIKMDSLYQELNQYSKNVGGLDYEDFQLIVRMAFPILDQDFSIRYNPYTFPYLINPEFAEKTDVFNKLKEYGIDKTGWFSISKCL